ncbi:MAG: VWA domain-containing protein [Acidobacteriota bacterium]|nr:VWA domain-containing protein [Acidobacteriota bacterium]
MSVSQALELALGAALLVAPARATTPVPATVVEPGGGPVRGLVLEDFALREDGEPQQLLEVDTVEAVPLDVALLMDVSASMKDGLDEAVASATRFLQTALRPDDEAAFFTFNHQPSLVVPLTGDLDLLRSGVEGATSWGGTALWDSAMLALYYLQGHGDRRTIVILSDGLDTDSEARFHEVYESAVRSGTAMRLLPLSAARDQVSRLGPRTVTPPSTTTT